MTPITLDITNATKISQTNSFETFGGPITWKTTAEVSVEAVFSDILNPKGQILSFTDIDEIQNSNDYLSISIANKKYQRCKIISFNLASGNLNKSQIVKLKFKTESRDASILSSLSGYYADYATANSSSSALIDSLRESISIANGENSIRYSKEVSVKFNNSVKLTGASSNPLVSAAANFVKKIFNYDSTTGYSDTIPNLNHGGSKLYDLLLQSNYKKFRNEKFDLITNECTFSESIDAANVVGDYSHSAVQTLSFDQNGITTVTETGTIKGLVESLINSAEIGYASEIVNAKTRLIAIYETYSGCSAIGNNSYLSIDKTSDQFNGTIQYSIVATNDPKFENSSLGIEEEFATTIATRLSITTVTRNGRIHGIHSSRYLGTQNGLNKYPAYLLAKTRFATVFNQAKTDIPLLANNLSPKYVERTESHSPLRGEITWSLTFSSDPKYANNDEVKSFDVQINEDERQNKVNEFLIINDGPLIQSTSGVYQGSKDMSCKIIGYRIEPSIASAKLAKADFINFAKDKFAGEGDNDYLESADMSINPFNDVGFSIDVRFLKV